MYKGANRQLLKIMQTDLRKIKILIVASLILMLNQCISTPEPYKGYLGEERSAQQLALLRGAKFSRQDWLNRYVDTIRFMSVDGSSIENSERYDELQLAPGFHDVMVYFSWDTGSQRGLAPAMVNYASSRDTVSRALRFNALAGEIYYVKGEPVFNSTVQDITTLAHVNFWVEDDEGNMIVTPEEGKYVPQS